MTIYLRGQPGESSSRVILSLFGLASGGVYPPSRLLAQAVSSYLTISPLPFGEPKGGLFLLHFPSGRPAPRCRGHHALRSPDFPLPCGSRHPANSTESMAGYVTNGLRDISTTVLNKSPASLIPGPTPCLKGIGISPISVLCLSLIGSLRFSVFVHIVERHVPNFL